MKNTQLLHNLDKIAGEVHPRMTSFDIVEGEESASPDEFAGHFVTNKIMASYRKVRIKAWVAP